jgi:hypothetical protein
MRKRGALRAYYKMLYSEYASDQGHKSLRASLCNFVVKIKKEGVK